MSKFKGKMFLFISYDLVSQDDTYVKLGLYIDDLFHYIRDYIVVAINIYISSFKLIQMYHITL